jgi:predicted double-glycine peptidase
VTGVYAGNAVITATINGITQASWNITVNKAVSLNVKVYRQTTNYTCSAAASLAVLRYYGKETQTKDTTLYKSINGYVGKATEAINKRLNGMYKWATFRDVKKYEDAIYKSLAQGSPVIARVKFKKGYFNYSSDGHYTTIIGMYKDANGETWLKLVDSFVDRYKSNSYTNKDTGIVHVPLKELYKYGTYGGTSDIYLIYNP